MRISFSLMSNQFSDSLSIATDKERSDSQNYAVANGIEHCITPDMVLRVNICQFYTEIRLKFYLKILVYRFFLSQNNYFVFNWTVNII